MPGPSVFDGIFGRDDVAELDAAAAVETGVRLFILEGGAVRIGGYAVLKALGGCFAGGACGGEGTKEGHRRAFREKNCSRRERFRDGCRMRRSYRRTLDRVISGMQGRRQKPAAT